MRTFLILILTIAVFHSCWSPHKETTFDTDTSDCKTLSWKKIKGDYIELSLDSIPIDSKINFSGGKFLFSHTEDTIPPIMIKCTKSDSVVWAMRFSFTKPPWRNILSEPRLGIEKNRPCIIFFWGWEPGKIILTKDYNFDYMYLIPF